MFFDIHCHAVEQHAPHPNWGKAVFSEPEEVLAIYDLYGIERGVLLPLGNPELFSVQSNEEVLRIAKCHPDRFVPFCNIDPRNWGNTWQAPIADLLKAYRELGCKGVGEVGANLQFLDPRVQNLFRACEEVGLPILFHMSPFEGYNYGLVDNPGLPQLEECLRRFPKLTIIGHSQTFWAEIAQYQDTPLDGPETWWGTRFGWPASPIPKEGRIQELLRKYPNLYCDLSAGSGFNALNRDLSHAVRFLNEFQDRLMFGTDICVAAPENVRLPKLLNTLRDEGKISQQVFQKISWDNATKLLGV